MYYLLFEKGKTFFGQVHYKAKRKYASFPVTCPKFLGSVGRQTFFFIKTIFVWKKYENP